MDGGWELGGLGTLRGLVLGGLGGVGFPKMYSFYTWTSRFTMDWTGLTGPCIGWTGALRTA